MYATPYHTADLSQYNFLVTGGAGFIGSHLVEYLLQHNAKQVRVIDDLSNGSLKNLQNAIEHPHFQFIKGDITYAEDCEMAVAGGIDFVLHQAALGSVPRSIAKPEATHHANVTGTLNMLVASQKVGVKCFVYASSSSVYGNHPDLPKKEGIEGAPLSPYAASKYACELYAQSFYQSYQLPTIGLRYFNVYGSRQSAHSAYAAVIPLFAKAVLEGKPPCIFGDGTQARDFTFIENVVKANVLACFAEKKAFGEVFNIGNGQRTSVLDLALEMITLSDNTALQPHFEPPRLGDVKFSLADIQKAKTYLSYAPEVSFHEGIRRTFAWYQENLII